jgi:hypothetical protein
VVATEQQILVVAAVAVAIVLLVRRLVAQVDLA